MKNKITRKKPPSPKRSPAKPAKRTTPSPSSKPAKAPSKPAAKSTPARPTKTSKRRALVHLEPANAPKPDAAPAPPPAPPAPSFDAREERDIPGEAIDGYRLALGIRYAAKVTPKEDGVIVFTPHHGPHPLVSGHDQRRAHTAYFGAKAAFHFTGVVPRDEALAFADMLDGLSWPRVRLGADGKAVISHGTAQPTARFDLGTRAITQRWQPPTQQDHPTPAAGPLRINAGWQAQACRWGKAVAHVYQSASGIEWVTLSDAETGELLARAVLAEDGHDLYPEDDRQLEITGSRTAGRLAPVTVREPAPRTNTEKMAEAAESASRPTEPAPPVEEPTPEADGGVTIEADGVEVAIDPDDASPVETVEG